MLNEVATHPFEGTANDTSERPRLQRSLGPDKRILLMDNHGPCTCGRRCTPHPHLTIITAFAWGSVVGATLWFTIDPLCRMVELDPEATRYAREYVQVLAYSMPFCSVMMVASMWPSVAVSSVVVGVGAGSRVARRA